MSFIAAAVRLTSFQHLSAPWNPTSSVDGQSEYLQIDVRYVFDDGNGNVMYAP